MPSDLKPSEKEEREVERLINRKPAPSRKNRSKRGPKHETRRRRMKVDDPDVGKADKDLSLNYKYASSLFIIASRMVLADDLSGPVESLEEEIQVLRTSIGGASKSILADFDSWCENNIDPSINSIDRIERMKERQGGKLNKEISSQLKSLTSTVQKKISSLQRAFDTTSKIRLSGLDQKRILDIVSDIWSRQGASFGSKAGILSALKSAIDSSGFPKSISIALSRDPSDKAAKSKVLQEIVKDFGSSFNEEELKKSDFIALAAMSAIYRIMSKNPDSFNERAVKKSVDDMTSRIYDQVQELATIGTFMDAWSEAAEKHFGENPKDYGYKLADPSALHKAMEGFFSRPSSSDDLFDAVDVGKAMVKASKDRFGKVPEFLSKFASISSESQSSYETVQTEMLKTASYHGVQKQGHPSGSGPHWSSPDKRYIGKSHHDSIIASAKEFLSKDGWFKDWNGGAKDAPIRAALDLAIHTADESAYQSKIDASTYEMLLNRLGSYNYNLFSDTLIPGSKRSSSTMKKDAISNILRIASEIRKKDPKMALSLAQSVRSLASEQAQQAQQQQGQQQEQAQQEQQGGSAFMPNEKKIEDMDESAKKKLVDELSKGVDELLKADDISDFLTGLKEVENVTKKVGSFRPRIAAGLVDLQKLLSEMEDMPEQDQKALMQMWKEGEKPLSDAKKELEKAGEGFTAEDLEAFAAGLDEALGGLEEEVKKAHTGSVRISLATLVRLAHSTPSTRSVLLPIIAAKKDKKDKKKGKKVSQKKEEAPSKEKAPAKGKAPAKEKAPVKGKAPKGKVKKASIQIDISDANWLSVTTFIYFNTRR